MSLADRPLALRHGTHPNQSVRAPCLMARARDCLGCVLRPGAVPGHSAGYPGSPQTTQASHVVPAVIRALSTGTALRSQL